MTEKVLRKNRNGMAMLLLLILCILGGLGGGCLLLAWSGDYGFLALPGILLVVFGLICILCLTGLKVLRPQEALVLTLFGKYVGECLFFHLRPILIVSNEYDSIKNLKLCFLRV